MTNFNVNGLREGSYTGDVKSQALTESSTGTFLFELEFENLVFQDGTETGSPVAGDTICVIRLPMTDRAATYTIRKLATLGYEGSADQFTSESPDHISIVGNQGKLHMKNSDWGADWDVSIGKGTKPLGLMDAKQQGAKWSHLMPKAPPKPEGGTPPPAAPTDGNSW